MVWLKALWHFIGVGKVITWEGFLIFSFKDQAADSSSKQ